MSCGLYCGMTQTSYYRLCRSLLKQIFEETGESKIMKRIIALSAILVAGAMAMACGGDVKNTAANVAANANKMAANAMNAASNAMSQAGNAMNTATNAMSQAGTAVNSAANAMKAANAAVAPANAANATKK
jgi:hypothetical protein